MLLIYLYYVSNYSLMEPIFYIIPFPLPPYLVRSAIHNCSDIFSDAFLPLLGQKLPLS